MLRLTLVLVCFFLAASNLDASTIQIPISPDQHRTDLQTDLSSTKLANLYLAGRTIEYVFKSAGLPLWQANFSLATQTILGIGCAAGYFGSWFQGHQGYRDLQLIRQGILDPNPDKRTFAYVALIRGVLNIAANSLFIAIYLAPTPHSWIWFSMGTIGIATAALGLIKNIRDVKKNEGIERTAFIFCALSRLPFLYASGASTWNGLSSPDMPYSIECQIAAMVTFVIGATLRQIKTYVL